MNFQSIMDLYKASSFKQILIQIYWIFIILFYDLIFGYPIYYGFAIIFYIMNIDQKDAEVQQYFTNMKKQNDI